MKEFKTPSVTRAARSALVTLVLAVAFVAAGPVGAVELYRAVALPDEGHGSSANGFSVPTGADKMEVVGEMTLPSSLRVPVHWRHDLSDGTTILTQLPITPSFQGAANAIVAEPSDRCLAVGTLIDGDGVNHAVLWREHEHEEEPEQGEAPVWFSAVPLPDQGNGSRANGLIPDIGSTRGDVVGDVTLAGGRTVPAKWTIDLITEDITLELLPIPPNTQGTANSITQAENGDLIAVGTLSRNGRSRAAQWTFDGVDWSGAVLGTPSGADSAANGVAGIIAGGDSVIASAGATCVEAGCFATMWGPGGNSRNLHTNPDFDASSATALFGGGGALAAVGTVSGPGGSVGALFLPQSSLAADVNQLLVNPEEGVAQAINAIGDRGLMAGRGNPCDNPNVDCGVIFIPVLGIVAQQMNVGVGSVAAGDVTSTWQDDGDRLRLVPDQAGGQRTVRAGFEAQQIGTVGPVSDLTIDFSANGVSNNQNATWAVGVQAFNFDTGQWDNVGQVEATTTETEFSLGVPDDPNRYIDGSQSFRTRFRIGQTTGGGPWRFEFDVLNIKVEQPPG